jgi:hypothetical protein
MCQERYHPPISKDRKYIHFLDSLISMRWWWGDGQLGYKII